MKKLILPVLLLMFCFGVKSSAYVEGDTTKFWSVSYVDWLKTDLPKQYEITAICRKVGNNCYFFEDVLAAKADSNTINQWVNALDTNFIRLTNYYGPIPDALDKDPKIIILSIKDTWWGGYFDPTHQMPDTMVNRIWGIRSSEHEIIFVSAKQVQPGREFIVAHEFGHMLHWGQDHSPEPPEKPTSYWEDTWIDEGFSTLAEVLLTQKIDNPDVFDNSAFFADTAAIPLIYFQSYNASKLWMVYNYEKFGGKKFIKALAGNQLNGIAGMEDTWKNFGFDNKFNDVFEDWTLSYYLDDKTYDKGQYYFNHFNFPKKFHKFTHQNYSGSNSGSLPAYSSQFITIKSNSWDILDVEFQADDTASFKVDFIKMDTTTGTIYDIQKCSSEDHLFNVYKTNKNVNRIIMAVMNTKAIPAGALSSYSYTLSRTEVSVQDNKEPELTIHYNPESGEIQINSTGIEFPTHFELYDLLGQKIQSSELNGGQTALSTQNLPKGIYFYKALINNKIATGRFFIH